MGMMGLGDMPWVDELNLSAEQTEQIRTIRDQTRTDTTELRQQLRAAHQEMQTLMANDASADQLRNQHQEVQDLMQQLGDEHFDAMLAVRDVLTPEQRAQLTELQQQRRGNPMNFDLEESTPQ
jgi:Spy/CpxP family protein refolding chaperone